MALNFNFIVIVIKILKSIQLLIALLINLRAPKNRPLHLHAVEPGNLADSYRRSIRIVPIDCQSKRRDVCTAAQRRRGDTVVVS